MLSAYSVVVDRLNTHLPYQLPLSPSLRFAIPQVTKKLDEVLDSKNQLIKALQYDIAKVSKAHNDLIRVYEAKLAEFGVPVEELGFRPLITNTSPGPAGLVVGA